jgi:hypothetical protein
LSVRILRMIVETNDRGSLLRNRSSSAARIKRFVTIPFAFVVGGKTLPAGTYRVSRLVDDKFERLILSSYENRIRVFVHPVQIESTSAERPHLSFEQVGEEPSLSRIQTTDDVYNIPVSLSLIMEAREKTRTTGPLQEVRKATKSSLFGLAGGSSGTSAQILPPPSSTHFTSPGQVTADIAKKPNFRVNRNFSWFR